MSILTKYKTLFVTIGSIFCYFYFAYFLDRTNFYSLLILWILLFSFFYILIKDKQNTYSNLVGFAILFRVIFLFATPNLSQDFYRFIWDGRMLLEGFNPYLSLPETFINNGLKPISDANLLYDNMGELNGSHYTNYPPLNQLSFLIAALVAKSNIFFSIIVLRMQIIFADLGILYFGKKLLENLNLNKKAIFLYMLNPFIIVEMTGNLHFEPVMLFFLISGIYLLQQQKWLFASMLIACSISVKLLPLLLLPFLIKFIFNREKTFSQSFRKAFKFIAIVLLLNLLFFLPFYSSELINNYTNSVGLWFRKFEFNASFYYLFREIGYLFRGYNEIWILGKLSIVVTLLYLCYVFFFKKIEDLKKLILVILILICVYYFTSTTIHPWYLATPLLLSIFTRFRFILIWSFTIILSYNAYANNPWQENLLLTTIEYLVVFGFLFYEIKYNKLKLLKT